MQSTVSMILAALGSLAEMVCSIKRWVGSKHSVHVPGGVHSLPIQQI